MTVTFLPRNMHKVRSGARYSARVALNAACVCSLIESFWRYQRGESFFTRSLAENAVWFAVFALAFAVAFLLELRSA